jgi:hypothetical protein
LILTQVLRRWKYVRKGCLRGVKNGDYQEINFHRSLWKEAVPRPPPSLVCIVEEGEPSYDYGNLERVCI